MTSQPKLTLEAELPAAAYRGIAPYEVANARAKTEFEARIRRDPRPSPEPGSFVAGVELRARLVLASIGRAAQNFMRGRP